MMKILQDKSDIDIFKLLAKEYCLLSGESFEKFQFHLSEQFANVDFSGKRVLEVGCGWGFVSLCLALNHPTAHFDALDEALGEGSEKDVIGKLDKMISLTGVKNVQALRHDIMQYHPADAYDIVISNNAMHHVCEHGLLKWDVRAMKKYVEIFEHIRSLLGASGFLMLHEYSRLSLWRFIRIKSFAFVEWSLHPTRGEWLSVLKKAGFTALRSRYATPYSLRKLAVLVRNPIAMFFYYPNFYLVARK